MINHTQSEISMMEKKKQDLLQTKEHDFYVGLVGFFAPAFYGVSDHDLQLISKSSYQYFRALLIIDGVIDEDLPKKSLVESLFLLEASVLQLAEVFPLRHPFWDSFEILKKKYFKIILLEKELFKTPFQVKEEDFLKIAEGKSVVSHAVVLALNEAAKSESGSSQTTQELMNCLKFIHIGFQCLDDTDDFLKDLDSGQPTYAQTLVLKKIGTVMGESLDHDLSHRFFYTSGIASDLLSMALEYFKLAKSIASQYNLEQLCQFLHTEIDKTKEQIREVGLLIQKTKDKSSLSNIKFVTLNATDNSDLNSQMNIGLSFIKSCLPEGGVFTDFMTTAGASDIWVTSFISVMLRGLVDSNQLIQSLKSSGVFSNECNLVSYNSTIGADGDSLTFNLAARKVLGVHIADEMVNGWLEHRSESGGWYTYLDDNYLKKRLGLDEVSVNGWVKNNHQCVSASACFTLSLFPEYKDLYYRSAEYLSAATQQDGSLFSYWWSSRVYATAWKIIAFAQDNLLRNEASESMEWLLANQDPEGYWRDEIFGQPSNFFTALAAKALLCAGLTLQNKGLKLALEFLKNSQMSDGSWPSTRILTIPATDVVNSQSVKKWRKSSFGVNTVVDDHRRLFTTASVLSTLSDYNKAIQQGL